MCFIMWCSSMLNTFTRAELISFCLDGDPISRPNFDVISKKLAEIADKNPFRYLPIQSYFQWLILCLLFSLILCTYGTRDFDETQFPSGKNTVYVFAVCFRITMFLCAFA